MALESCSGAEDTHNDVQATVQNCEMDGGTESTDFGVDSTVGHGSEAGVTTKDRMRSELETLRKEMELVEYSRVETGQNRRKVFRSQRKLLNMKRKALDRKDYDERAIAVESEDEDDGDLKADADKVERANEGGDEDNEADAARPYRRDGGSTTTANKRRKRLRGAKLAFADEVIQGSLIFGPSEDENNADEGGDDGVEMSDSEEEKENDEEDDDDENDVEHDEDEEADDEDADEKQDGDLMDETVPNDSTNSGAGDNNISSTDGKGSRKSTRGRRSTGGRARRYMYRLRDFKSRRLAKRHGEALGAHARGMHATSVSTLSGVASSVPSAPQVYSALGLVYENLLHDDAKGGEMPRSNRNPIPSKSPLTGPDERDTTVEDVAVLASRVEVAKKAYASYHVAAVLCKKDFTLWVRAGDTASEIATLHAAAIEHPSTTTDCIEELHRPERRRWIEEAKADYMAADNLRPPGISVPAKLAAAHMELGNFSEALTILTDLKNRTSPTSAVSGQQQRSELERSYSAWLLYADLMLRIGHECGKWRRGDLSNENYMFRRWLRKYCKTFDWRERRLQALCLALEAAAGSESCAAVVNWARTRSKRRGKDNESSTETSEEHEPTESRWNMDNYESDQSNHKEKQNQGESEKEDAPNDDHEECVDGQECPEKVDDNPEKNSNGNADDNPEKNSNGNADDNPEKISNGNTDDNPEKISNGNTDDNAEKNSNGNTDPTGDETVPKENSSAKTNNLDQTHMNENKESDVPIPFENERRKLIVRHRRELDQFDKETESMCLVAGSPAERGRDANRRTLVAQQKATLLRFAREYTNRKTCSDPPSDVVEESGEESKNSGVPNLPMAESCSTVCHVATLLMKQCLDRELYHGGRLVGGAVSSYLSARARQRQNHIQNRLQDIKQRKNRFESGLLCIHEHDEIRDSPDDSGDDDDDDVLISDDEELRTTTDKAFLENLRRGVLPTELQLLNCLCLIGTGGRDFLAEKAMMCVNSLQEGSLDQLADSLRNSDLSPDPSWMRFRQRFISPLRKPAALALVSRTIAAMGKEEEWGGRLSHIFKGYSSETDLGIVLETLGREDGADVAAVSMMQGDLTTVLITSLRYQMIEAQNLAGKSEKKTEEGAAEAIQIAETVCGTLFRFEQLLWSELPESGVLPSTSIEVLLIYCQAFSILVRYSSDVETSTKEAMVSLFDRMNHVVATVFDLGIPPLDQQDNSAESSTSIGHKWTDFPLAADWQSTFHNVLSLKTYNMCVGSCLSEFSGWLHDEFKMDLLMSIDGPRSFGVSLDGITVAGILDTETESELTRLWNLMANLVPNCKTFDMKSGLEETRTSEWRTFALDNFRSGMMNGKATLFGENHGLRLLTQYAKLCLLRAKFEDGQNEEELVKRSMSVLLPASQFCLGKTLWYSSIGLSVTARNEMSDWREKAESRLKRTAAEEGRAYVPPPRARPLSKPGRHPRAQGRGNGEGDAPPVRKSPLHGLVKVPISALLREWKREGDGRLPIHHGGGKCSDEAQLAMRRVDYALRQLRACTTVASLQRTSIHVAEALLEVASKEECENIFVCLHHAAMFAGQGAKGGNNDEFFKSPLPSHEECTPHAALMILGRADCLRAIHFFDEAIFLCSHVTRTCQLRRGGEASDWTPRWRVVSMHLYAVSVTVDATVHSVFEHEDDRQPILDLWEESSKKEISRGRSDAFALYRVAMRSSAVWNSGVRDSGDAENDADAFGASDGAKQRHNDADGEDNGAFVSMSGTSGVSNATPEDYDASTSFASMSLQAGNNNEGLGSFPSAVSEEAGTPWPTIKFPAEVSDGLGATTPMAGLDAMERTADGDAPLGVSEESFATPALAAWTTTTGGGVTDLSALSLTNDSIRSRISNLSDENRKRLDFGNAQESSSSPEVDATDPYSDIPTVSV